MHDENCFITLTYDDEHRPERNQLKHEDFQKFMKRLREHIQPKKARYYMAGEYSPLNGLPHFHACIFGHDWNDKKYLKTTPSGEKIYRSATLEKLWTFGYSSTAHVTFESAAYVARYCVQKVTGDAAEEHYKRFDHLGEYQLNEEYNRMSLKPGIGATWLDKYKKDVYNYDYVVINGKKTQAPRYYDKLYERQEPDNFDQIKEDRILKALERALDNTDERLAVKEQVTLAAIKQLKKSI